jgi:hypothetical protein
MALFKEKKRLEDEVAVLPRQGGMVLPPPPPTVMGHAPIPQVISVTPVHTPTPPPTLQTGWGVENLTKLMRELPNGNVELVVRVLKKTLEAVRISVPGLIQDAARRETELEEKMAGHRRAIAALEDEISSKRRAIEDLELHYREVMMVKERLNLALTLDQQEVSVRPARPDTIPHEEVVHTPTLPSQVMNGRGPNRG